ncbi:MAG: hypothetical protein QM736_28790, partial [Vicinamibacterales bacterium]
MYKLQARLIVRDHGGQKSRDKNPGALHRSGITEAIEASVFAVSTVVAAVGYQIRPPRAQQLQFACMA